VKYVRRNFLCGLLGREPGGMEALNAQLRQWVQNVANQRMHGTTHEEPVQRWPKEREHLQQPDGRPPYPYLDEELRRVARDAYVAWHGSRYSVPWAYAGKEVWVCERSNYVEVHYGAQRIAIHERAGRHHTVTQAEHHRGIPLGSRSSRDKILVQLRETAPVVEVRSLAAYESAAGGLA
jgi:hypothetical protein